MDYDKLIRRRWKVEGFYHLFGGGSMQRYKRSYHFSRDVVWEFGDRLMTCRIEGRADHLVRFAIFSEHVLYIYYPSVMRYFSHNVKQYVIVPDKNGNDLLLCDNDSRNSAGEFKRAIKLSPAE